MEEVSTHEDKQRNTTQRMIAKENTQAVGIKPILNRRELASYLGISLSTLDAQIKKGMPYFPIGNGKRGGIKRFRVEDVMLWLHTQKEMRK